LIEGMDGCDEWERTREKGGDKLYCGIEKQSGFIVFCWVRSKFNFYKTSVRCGVSEKSIDLLDGGGLLIVACV
jgi:hypothetical protein